MRSVARTKLLPILKGVAGSSTATTIRNFSTARQLRAPNKIYDPVRRPDDLHTYQLLSSSAGRPLATLWTASWCATCRTVEPLVRSVVAETGAGEAEGGVGFCVVEFDAPDVMAAGLGGQYMISSLPTLLCFDERGEPRSRDRVSDARLLADRKFLEEWFRAEARRAAGGGGGGGGGGGLFKGWR